MLKNIKQHLKNNKNIYCTFFIGIIIISTIFILEKITPFGENSTLAVDFYHQYGPMLGELYDRIKSGSNLLYSFTMSSGLPIFRNFLNYLSSPLNIIILLFKRENLLTAYSFIIGLKAVLAGTTFTYFVEKKFNLKSTLTIALGLLFSFQAYFIAYYWNIMWLDGLIFIPLITLGIEKIVNENKALLYIISLALMILTNYFIGYMLCIFSVIYFLIYLISKKKKSEWKNALKISLKFIISSLLAGLLTAFLTLPLFSSISSTSATSDTLPLTRYYQFSPIEFVINHLTGVSSTVFSSDITNAPNISCGIISIPLLFIFIFNKQIKLKTKICYLSALLILILSFFFAPLDFIWHAFHVPNDLPYRFSFIYTFILLTISAYSLIKIKNTRPILIFISYIFTLLIILLSYFYNIDQVSNKMLIINAVLISIYFVIYIISKYYKYTRKIMTVIFIGVIGLECIIRVSNNWEINQLIDDYYYNYNGMKNALNFIKENDTEEFYRVEQTDTMTLNDSSWYHYNGITSFSSMNYEALAILQRDLGIPGNEINSFYYTNNTPIYNLVFNLKYIIGDPYDYKHYKNILLGSTFEVYENKYNLNLLYGVNKNIKNWELIEYDPIRNQNTFIENCTGIQNVLEKNKIISKEVIDKRDDITLVKYTFKNNFDTNYFYNNAENIEFFIINETLYYEDNIYETINYSFPQINYYSSENYTEKKLINFNDTNELIDIYVGYSFYNNDLIDIYSLNENKFNSAYNILKNNEASITIFKENKIKATIDLKEKMTIYTSIPYDEGWNVLVDGKKVHTYKIANSLLAFDLESGKHTITIKYFPKHMILGASISISSLLAIIYLHKKKKVI